jgi:hypothetical protein
LLSRFLFKLLFCQKRKGKIPQEKIAFLKASTAQRQETDLRSVAEMEFAENPSNNALKRSGRGRRRTWPGAIGTFDF